MKASLIAKYQFFVELIVTISHCMCVCMNSTILHLTGEIYSICIKQLRNYSMNIGILEYCEPSALILVQVIVDFEQVSTHRKVDTTEGVF